MNIYSNNNDILSDLKDWIENNPIDYSELLFDPFLNKEEAIKRNSEFVTCNKCGVIGNKPNMLRWHFDKCTTVLRTCKQCNKTIPRQNIKPIQYDVKKHCNRKCYTESKKGKIFLEMTQERKDNISKKQKQYHAGLKINKNK